MAVDVRALMPPLEDVSAGSARWWLDRLSRRLAERQGRLATYQSYYEGDHDLKYATAKFREAFGSLFGAYAENVCELVVESTSERLHVAGFRMGSDATLEADKDAWRIWQSNQMDAWQTTAHTLALVQEESYLAVWADPDDERTPMIRVLDPQTTIVAHDPSDARRRSAALRLWRDEWDGRILATVYLPDGTYKFQTTKDVSAWRESSVLKLLRRNSTRDWERREVRGEPWPLPNPLGVVPIVPLVNRPRADMSGRSELKSVIPINDAINKLVSDMLLAAEFGAFRHIGLRNFQLETDPDTGKPIEPFRLDMQRLLVTPPPEPGEPAPEWHQFEQTSLEPYISSVEQRLQMIATITRTPHHYILGGQGNYPSGETLKAVEAGLVAKAGDKALWLGEGHEEAIRLAFRVLGDKRGTITDSESIWHDMETRNEAVATDAAVKRHGSGIATRRQAREDVGYSPQQIARMEAEEAAAGEEDSQPPPPEDGDDADQ